MQDDLDVNDTPVTVLRDWSLIFSSDQLLEMRDVVVLHDAGHRVHYDNSVEPFAIRFGMAKSDTKQMSLTAIKENRVLTPAVRARYETLPPTYRSVTGASSQQQQQRKLNGQPLLPTLVPLLRRREVTGRGRRAHRDETSVIYRQTYSPNHHTPQVTLVQDMFCKIHPN